MGEYNRGIVCREDCRKRGAHCSIADAKERGFGRFGIEPNPTAVKR